MPLAQFMDGQIAALPIELKATPEKRPVSRSTPGQRNSRRMADVNWAADHY
jgi:hypothetical protein